MHLEPDTLRFLRQATLLLIVLTSFNWALREYLVQTSVTQIDPVRAACSRRLDEDLVQCRPLRLDPPVAPEPRKARR